MAFVHLKNAGVTSNESLDFRKTQVTLIVSEKIGNDLFRQMHLVNFYEKAGTAFEVITINDASSEECSMSGVEVFLIERRFGDDLLK